MNQPNVWTVDIETTPLVALVWELGKQYVSKDQVIEDWHIMAFSAKKLNDKSVPSVYMETRTKNDRPLLKKLWEIFNDADVVITQNGKRFDEPKIRARMMLSGFNPYKPFKHHDTFEQNKDKEFTSHSLDYLSDKFCTKYKKLKHKLFAGLSLWKECLGIKIQYNPNPAAWVEMKTYNIHDVLATEELYLNTRGWSKSTAPTLYRDIGSCCICGKQSLQKRGIERTKNQMFQRLQCQSCGKWQRGEAIKREITVTAVEKDHEWKII